MNKKTGILSHINFYDFIFLIYIFCLTCGYGRLTNYISSVLSIIIFLICINDIKKDKGVFLCFFIFYVYHILTSLVFVKDLYYFLGTLTLGVFNRFVPLLLFLRISNYKFDHKLSFLKACLLIWVPIVIVSTITYINTDGGGRVYTNNNFGSLLGGCYAAAYCSALISIVCFQFLLDNLLSKRAKIFFSILMILSILHVVTTNSMITTIAMVLGLALSLFLHGKSKKTSLFSYGMTAILIFLSFAIIFNAENIGKWLIDFSGKITNITYSQRINEIGLFLYSNDETYHVGKRIEVIFISLKSFVNSPILGNGYKYGNDFIMLKNASLVGNHSEILDLLAQYGLFAIPIFIIYAKKVTFIVKSSQLKMAIPFFASFFVLVMLNPFISDQTNYFIFLLLPLMTSCYGGIKNETF